MENKSKKTGKPPFFVWVIIGIGVGALLGGGIFHNFVFGAGIGVGLGIILGLWSERIAARLKKK